MGEALSKARLAHEVAPVVAATGSETRSEAIRLCAQALRDGEAKIVAANGQDLERARRDGMSLPLQDRLTLTPERIAAIADAMDEVAGQSDPLGRVLSGHVLNNGLSVEKVTVPLGTVV